MLIGRKLARKLSLSTKPNIDPSKTPRVLQVIPELDAGGAERSAVDVARGIVEIGGLALVATRGGRLAGEVEACGGKVIPLSVHSKNPLTILANIVRLRRIIRDHDIEIVHVRSRAPAWSALPAARLSGIPFVTTYHGTYQAKSALKRLYNSGMARGDVVIANSDFIGERIRSEHKGLARHLVVIPRGTDLKTHNPRTIGADRLNKLRTDWGLEGETRPIALLPGRLTSWKGQAVMIEAIARLVGEGTPDFLTILAGDPQGRDDYVKGLWDAIERHDLSDRVRMVGHCSDMPAAYALSDFVISASTEPEAFGRVAVEAQAMERFIIATDHGGSEETVIDEGPDRTGKRIPPSDAEALARAISEVLTLQAEELKAIGKRGRENARQFSVEAMVASTLKVYDDLLKERI